MHLRGGRLLFVILLASLARGQARGWTEELYVWQRAAAPEVAEAMTTAAPLAAGFDVLAAEVSWKGATPTVYRATLDYGSLAKLGKPIGLVLRVGPFAGPFATDDAPAKLLAALAASVLAEARAGGLKPAELQIDFDAAEAKLDGYRTWLAALKTAAGKTPLIFTALPAWLHNDKEFAALAHAADGFILQVHSLEKPAAPDAPFTLCDPTKALAWAAQAAKVGVPFRIALPTYGYLVAFDHTGKFFALAAEGPAPAWPAGTQTRVVLADAPAMAGLAQSLEKNPPAHCTGVIWFRLPVTSDRLNWNWTTLQTVLRGATPAVKLSVQITWSASGLADVYLVNTGTATAVMPKQITLRWPAEAAPQAADTLAGFHLESELTKNQAVILNANGPVESLLPAGGRVPIAWLRFAHEISLDGTLPAAASP